MNCDQESIEMVVLAMPGDRVTGARVADIVVHQGQDAAFVAAQGPHGPMVLIAATELADALRGTTGTVDIRRWGLRWRVTPSRLTPIGRWPTDIDLRQWVERTFGPAETNA